MTIVKFFSGKETRALAEKIALAYDNPLGAFTSQKFSDGEIHISYDESIRGCEVFLIQSTTPPADNVFELLLMIDAARRASAKYVTVVVPYFGYARQDRKDKARVSIAAKLIANLLSASGADRLMTMDLHAGQIQGFFDIPVDHLDASALFVPYLKSKSLDNIVFAAPDVGGSARARVYAKFFNAEIAICDKQRKRANEVASMQVIGDVKGRNVVLVDDMIDTAGTLCKAAELIKEKGANSVRAVCAHGILSGKAHEMIAESVLEEVVISDSIPQKKENHKIKILSVAGLFAKAVRRVHSHESISELFI